VAGARGRQGKKEGRGVRILFFGLYEKEGRERLPVARPNFLFYPFVDSCSC